MDWATIRAGLSADLLGVFGEPVTLPWGDVTTGVFEPRGGPQPAAWGSDISRANRVSQDPGPVVTLASAACSELERGDILIIRELEYKIRRLTPDGDGLTRCELVLAERAGLGTKT